MTCEKCGTATWTCECHPYPYSEPKGHTIIDARWVLTHAIWHPTLPYGGHGSCPETGVRDLMDVDSKTGRPRFDLIQHGWYDFTKAQDVIVKGLRKGWSPFRISEAMDWLGRQTSLARVARGHKPE